MRKAKWKKTRAHVLLELLQFGSLLGSLALLRGVHLLEEFLFHLLGEGVDLLVDLLDPVRLLQTLKLLGLQLLQAFEDLFFRSFYAFIYLIYILIMYNFIYLIYILMFYLCCLYFVVSA